MKIRDGFITENIAGDNFVVATGDLILSFKDTILLNDTALFIFQNLKEETTVDDIVKKIVDVYDVDTSVARKDVLTVIDELMAHNVLEEN